MEDFWVSFSKLITIVNPFSLEDQRGKEGKTQRRQVIRQNLLRKEEIEEVTIIGKDSGKTSPIRPERLSASYSLCLIGCYMTAENRRV